MRSALLDRKDRWVPVFECEEPMPALRNFISPQRLKIAVVNLDRLFQRSHCGYTQLSEFAHPIFALTRARFSPRQRSGSHDFPSRCGLAEGWFRASRLAMRGGCGEPFRGPRAVVTYPASIRVQHSVRIVRTLEPCLLWPNRYRIGASQ
jgi:hypothetical protein